MKIDHIDNFFKGWFVGKFDPTLLKANFEVGYHRHKAGTTHGDHFHKLSTEINVIIEGTVIINGKTLGEGDIFIIYPYELSLVEYPTDVKLIVVRDLSDPTDKYEVEIR